jgi:hypothetical protein
VQAFARTLDIRRRVMLLLEEIAVELAMIGATLVALGVLVYMLLGFALEHARARREMAAEHSFARTRSHTTMGRHA